MQGIVTLGKEWRYYKKEIDQIKRAKKKAEEKAQMAQERQAGRNTGYVHPWQRDDRGDRGGREDRGGRDGRDNRRGGIGFKRPHS